MGSMASQITSLAIVYSAVFHNYVMTWKSFSNYSPFVTLPVINGFPREVPVMLTSGIVFNLILNKRLKKQQFSSR